MTNEVAVTPSGGCVVRPYAPSDFAAVCEICIVTGDAGHDVRAISRIPDIYPTLFAAPYVRYAPELAFVLDDGSGHAVGYVIGVADTAAFAGWQRARWLPLHEAAFPASGLPARDLDDKLVELLHHPEWNVRPQLVDYPAHLHIDVLPAHQGHGHGRALIAAFLSAARRLDVPAVHLAMVTVNTGARAFYDRIGFHEIDYTEPGLTFLGISTS